MFIILLRFGPNRAQAGQFMPDHKAWLKQGFDDNIFLLSGSLQPNQGGCILAQGDSLESVQACVETDPFVIHGIVTAEILQISPHQAAESMQFLLN